MNKLKQTLVRNVDEIDPVDWLKFCDAVMRVNKNHRDFAISYDDEKINLVHGIVVAENDNDEATLHRVMDGGRGDTLVLTTWPDGRNDDLLVAILMCMQVELPGCFTWGTSATTMAKLQKGSGLWAKTFKRNHAILYGNDYRDEDYKNSELPDLPYRMVKVVTDPRELRELADKARNNPHAREIGIDPDTGEQVIRPRRGSVDDELHDALNRLLEGTSIGKKILDRAGLTADMAREKMDEMLKSIEEEFTYDPDWDPDEQEKAEIAAAFESERETCKAGIGYMLSTYKPHSEYVEVMGLSKTGAATGTKIHLMGLQLLNESERRAYISAAANKILDKPETSHVFVGMEVHSNPKLDGMPPLRGTAVAMYSRDGDGNRKWHMTVVMPYNDDGDDYEAGAISGAPDLLAGAEGRALN